MLKELKWNDGRVAWTLIVCLLGGLLIGLSIGLSFNRASVVKIVVPPIIDPLICPITHRQHKWQQDKFRNEWRYCPNCLLLRRMNKPDGTYWD